MSEEVGYLGCRHFRVMAICRVVCPCNHSAGSDVDKNASSNAQSGELDVISEHSNISSVSVVAPALPTMSECRSYQLTDSQATS